MRKSPGKGFFLRKIFNNNAMWQYIKDVRGEMKHVSWPTRAQAVMYTIVVIMVSLVVAVYLGLLDFLFVEGLRCII